MKIITKNLAKKLIKGASILTTGGGVPPLDQLQTIQNFKQFQVKLVNLVDLPTDGYLVMAGELGPSDVPPLKKENLLKPMLKTLKKLSAKKIVGIYPPEIGQESVTLETAQILQLPIVDMDPVGSRAVPFIDISIFNLKNIKYSLSPLVVSTDSGEILTISGNISLERVEVVLRELTGLSKSGLLFLLGGLVEVKTLIDYSLQNNSYSLALKLGSATTREEIVDLLNPRLVIEGVVTKKTILKQKGFKAIKVKIKTKIDSLELLVLNEALVLSKIGGEILSCVPEKILLINPQTLEGLPSTNLDKGAPVVIMIIEPDSLWRSSKAEKLFGLERFKFLL